MIAPTLADLESAAQRLAAVTSPTPLLRCDALDAACGAQVYVKAEALQRTGSFKFRGAYNRLSRLTGDERTRGVVAFSSGNHAQGVAAAAAIVGCPAVIVMPSDAPSIKVEATLGYGAEVVPYDRFTQDREALAAALAQERGAVLVPSYDDPHIIAGQGTVGLEAVRQLTALGLTAQALVCPVSGGGLLAGINLAFAAHSPATALWAAEPAGFDDHARSLAAGRRVVNASGGRSLCDALLASTPGALTWTINSPRLAGGVSADDEACMAAMAFAFRHLKLVLEPGGAVALACALARKPDVQGGVLLVVASGGNVDPALYARALALA